MKLKPLPQNYTYTEAEKRWQRHWVNAKTYAWANDAPRDKTYVIDTPPPTVSGLLHMGHVFSYTQCDFVARYQRMKGMDVFYPMGFDDNGLPTERLVEKAKKIRAVDMSREDFIAQCMSVSEEARGEFRELFQSIALSVDWAQEYHTISESCRRISQESFLDLYAKGHVERQLKPFFWDPVDQTAIAQAEIEDKELDSSWNDIWFGVESSSCGSQSESAGSQADSAPDAKASSQNDKILIGTTRPELIPACVGIFYHPDDARYAHLAGKHAITPLFGVRVPILTDDTVDPEKGTGIMMCCTFGDEADIEKWKKHKLETRVVLNKFGKMDLSSLRGEAEAIHGSPRDFVARDDAIEKLNGKKISNRDPKHLGARETIIELLRESGDLKESKPIRHSVKCAERSGAPLEILPTHQWFVKVCDKKEALKKRANECNWNPDWMKLRMEQWIDGLNSDWCISRQRYFGVPFPVWYSKRAGEEGKILIADADQLPCNPLKDLPKGYSRDEIIPDADVMDTWATSSISPQLSAGSINCHPARVAGSGQTPSYDGVTKNERFAKLFPADLRPQAHEIIRTWAFYTVVKSHLHNDCIPWKNLMISGWCLAEDKTKMSKSKGNVVTPVELIQEQGTDAVRYWAATSRLGADTAFSKDLLKIGKKLVNKLWNATKFAAIHLEKLDESSLRGEAQAIHGSLRCARESVARGLITAPLDLWILTRLHRAVEKSTAAFECYEYADGLRAAEDFFWNDFCDNYLELVKARVYGHDTSSCGSQRESAGSSADGDSALLLRSPQDDEGQQSAVHTIYHALQGILKLFAPFVPHITEELYSHLFVADYEAKGSLHARGQWPVAKDYPLDASAEVQGIAAVSILNTIRKAKSERGVSIKYPIDRVLLYPLPKSEISEGGSSDILNDVTSAGNVAELAWSDHLPDAPLYTDDGRFALSLQFAAQADVA